MKPIQTSQRTNVTKDYVRKYFDYDKETGTLISKRSGNPMLSQKLSHGRPYIQVSCPGRGHILAHRLIWIYHYGTIPSGYVIHHKDNNSLNNKIENLECTTQKENMRHREYDYTKREKRISPVTGFVGIYYDLHHLNMYFTTLPNDKKRYHKTAEIAKDYIYSKDPDLYNHYKTETEQRLLRDINKYTDLKCKSEKYIKDIKLALDSPVPVHATRGYKRNIQKDRANFNLASFMLNLLNTQLLNLDYTPKEYIEPIKKRSKYNKDGYSSKHHEAQYTPPEEHHYLKTTADTLRKLRAEANKPIMSEEELNKTIKDFGKLKKSALDAVTSFKEEEYKPLHIEDLDIPEIA